MLAPAQQKRKAKYCPFCGYRLRNYPVALLTVIEDPPYTCAACGAKFKITEVP